MGIPVTGLWRPVIRKCDCPLGEHCDVFEFNRKERIRGEDSLTVTERMIAVGEMTARNC